jgi:hypothetical protein
VGARRSDTRGRERQPKSSDDPGWRYGVSIPSRGLCFMSIMVARDADNSPTKSR